MMTHSGQTINFRQSDSSRSGLASNSRSVAPDLQRRQMAGIVGRRKPGLVIHHQNGVLRKGRRHATEKQEFSLEGIFQMLRLFPKATSQAITMFRLIASKNSGLDPLHPSSRRWFRVVEALQMQQSMNQIKA
jgi:hypothetical protein